MSRRYGFWYWLFLTKPGFLLGGLSGLFGKEAQEEAEAASEDLGGAVVLLLVLGVIVGAVVVVAWLVTKAIG